MNKYNNKKLEDGFSLLEIILYMSLLSLLMIGLFSSTMALIHIKINKPNFTNNDYRLLIENFHE